jgi:CHAT domain
MATYRTTLGSANSTATLPNGTTLRATALRGTVVQWATPPGALRAERLPAEQDVNPRFAAALEELGMREQETLQFEAAPAPDLAGFRAGAATDTLIVQPAPPAEGDKAVQVVLYQDESGGLSWHFPDGFGAGPGRAPLTRGGRGLRPTRTTFTIPGRTVAARQAGAVNRPPAHLRGPITKIGRKIFKVLVIPLLSPLIEKPVQEIVEKIECKHRQNLVRRVTPDNYNTAVTDAFADWSGLAGQRALLIVHGIFSNTHGMLSEFPRADMEELCQRYGGRVIALDQLTVCNSPEDNARFFLEQVRKALPQGKIDFDILCHSRGGIVSRTLAERGAEILPGHNCNFRKVYFVATPNAGSPLADADHMVDMLDLFTNFLTNFPDATATYAIEIILAIIKFVAYASATSLPGLASMNTTGYIRSVLNASKQPSQAIYAASASNYEPDPNASNSFFTGSIGNTIMDRIFAREGQMIGNDLVVPQAGVWEANGHPSFPISDRVVYEPKDHVWHSGFFSRRQTLDHIKSFLSVPTPVDHHWMGTIKLDTESKGAPEPDATPSEEPGDSSPMVDASVPNKRPHFRDPKLSPRRNLEPNDLTAAPPVVVRRNPQIDFNELVTEGFPNDLVVRLEDLAGSSATDVKRALAIEFAAGESEIPLQVVLSAPGFDVEPPKDDCMHILRERDPAKERLTFRLTARSPGAKPVTREIRADFWLRNSCLGAVVHRTVVAPKDYKQPVKGDGTSRVYPVNIPAVAREDCDLLILVEGQDENGTPPYQIRLQCGIVGHEYRAKYMGKFNIDDPKLSLADYIHQLVESQFARLPDGRLPDAEFDRAMEGWVKEFNSNLDSLGKKLWSWLPEPLRNEYFRLRDQGLNVRSILVHSDELIVPWELIVPYRTNSGKLEVLAPLGRAHVLGRWKPGLPLKPQPQRLTVRKFTVVNPAYPPPDTLEAAAAEAMKLRELFPLASFISPADFPTFERDVLKDDKVQVLHISCHGEYNPANADLSGLILEQNGRLQAMQLQGTPLAAEASPFVYLNACSIGAAATVVGRMGGFAENVLNAGCSGLIAAYWPVDDEQAKRFSLALYDKLLAGAAMGEAMQELREEHPNDVTFRAFALYGDPWTRLNFDPLLK